MKIIHIFRPGQKKSEKMKALFDECQAYDGITLSPPDNSLTDMYIMAFGKGNELLGYMDIAAVEDALEIKALVSPKHRREGIFTQMQLYLSELLPNRKQIFLSDDCNPILSSFIEGSYKKTATEYLLASDVAEKESIVSLSAADYDEQFISCLKRMFFEFYSDEELTDIIFMYKASDTQPYYIVAENIRIGITLLTPSSKSYCISSFGIFEDYRRKGYGSAALSSIKKLLADRTKEITVEVSSQNSSALDMYYKCGFHEKKHISYYEKK